MVPRWADYNDYEDYYDNVVTPDENQYASQVFVTLPAQLAAPRLAGTTQNTVSLSWDPYEEIGSKAQFLHYEVRLESSLMEVSTRTTHVTEMLVGGLEPAETYAIKVRTVTTQGISPYSEALSVTTDGLTISKLEQLMDTLGILEMEVKTLCPI